jgi:hypothetical protein
VRANCLSTTYDRSQGWTDGLVAQQWVEGPDTDLYLCLCYFSADLEPLATFVYQKLRQWPPHLGMERLAWKRGTTACYTRR